MSFSNNLEAKVLQHFFGGVSQTAPQNLYAALYVSDPTEADTGTEVNGAGYARQQITFGCVCSSGTMSVIANAAVITFPQAAGSWGTITHIGIRDAATGGNLLFYAPLSISKKVESGDRMEFPAGAITTSLD